VTEHSRIEAACARYLELIGFLVILTHSSRNPPAENGIADLLAIRKAKMWHEIGNIRPDILAVEIKAGRDKLRADQEAWLTKARDQGVMILVVRSLEELQEEIQR
jgi:predicted glycosyltransferase